MPPLVSVVIPAYNCAGYIGEALTSVFAQSYRPIEVLVVDDGSTDRTAEVARGFAEVRYLRQENRGPSAARNHGIRLSDGDFIAFLDADDLWPADKLADQLALLQRYPEAGLAFGDMREFSAETGAMPSMFERYHLDEQYFGHREIAVDAVEKLMHMNFIPTGAVLARKAALSAAGLFDESRRLAEDWDLWLRVALRFPIVYAAKVWELKRAHQENVSRDVEAMTLAALDVLEQFKQNNGAALEEKGAVARRHLRHGYRNLGYFYLRQISLAKARRALLRSLSFGVDGRALLYLGGTFLGGGMVKSLLRVRG